MDYRYIAKADALTSAFLVKYHALPTKHAVEMILSVAEHETQCGDAWDGSGNWGAVQRRAMSLAEKQTVAAGNVPVPTDLFEELHGDSSPVTGRYQVWFWKFPKNLPCAYAGDLSGDFAGAWMLLRELIDRRPQVARVIDVCTGGELAEWMYRTRYFDGFHSPKPALGEVVSPGGLTQGQLANIKDYASALSRVLPGIRAALLAWTPGGPNIPPPPATVYAKLAGRIGFVKAIQTVLNAAGANPPLVVDGILGPKTRAATRVFQGQHEILDDGIAGVATIKKMEAFCELHGELLD